MTLNITLNIMKLRKITFSIRTLRIMTFSIITFRILIRQCDTQNDDIQLNNEIM
jgi:hypothetical protein